MILIIKQNKSTKQESLTWCYIFNDDYWQSVDRLRQICLVFIHLEMFISATAFKQRRAGNYRDPNGLFPSLERRAWYLAAVRSPCSDEVSEAGQKLTGDMWLKVMRWARYADVPHLSAFLMGRAAPQERINVLEAPAPCLADLCWWLSLRWVPAAIVLAHIGLTSVLVSHLTTKASRFVSKSNRMFPGKGLSELALPGHVMQRWRNLLMVLHRCQTNWVRKEKHIKGKCSFPYIQFFLKLDKYEGPWGQDATESDSEDALNVWLRVWQQVRTTRTSLTCLEWTFEFSPAVFLQPVKVSALLTATMFSHGRRFLRLDMATSLTESKISGRMDGTEAAQWQVKKRDSVSVTSKETGSPNLRFGFSSQSFLEADI